MSEPDKPKLHFIFTDEERRQFVRNFVEAYLANEVEIEWVSDEHFTEFKKKLGVTEGTGTPAIEYRLQLKEQVREWIMQVFGYVDATYDEVENAYRELCKFIIANRMGNRIKGSFYKGSITEQRLKDLEDKVASHGRLIESLRMLGHVGENDNDNVPQV